MVLSSWQSHCKSSPTSRSSRDDKCRAAPGGRQPLFQADWLSHKFSCRQKIGLKNIKIFTPRLSHHLCRRVEDPALFSNVFCLQALPQTVWNQFLDVNDLEAVRRRFTKRGA